MRQLKYHFALFINVLNAFISLYTRSKTIRKIGNVHVFFSNNFLSWIFDGVNFIFSHILNKKHLFNNRRGFICELIFNKKLALNIN